MDGSTLHIPDTEELRAYFGSVKFKIGENKKRAMARLSLLHDVLNRITYDAIGLTITNPNLLLRNSILPYLIYHKTHWT